jgi:hypothetical protein
MESGFCRKTRTSYNSHLTLPISGKRNAKQLCSKFFLALFYIYRLGLRY